MMEKIMKNNIQKAVDQIGELTVLRYLPKGMKLHDCPMHGKFLAHYKDENPLCPLCNMDSGSGNGTTATDMQHYIEIRDAVQQGTGITIDILNGRKG